MSRVVPADGRSRAYLDGRMATVSALAEQGGRLVDLHGQHAHQSLFSAGAQRAALDSYAGVQRDARDAARAEVRQLQAAMAGAGGDAAARARERELLRYQLAELDAVGLQGADEDDRLADEEDRLGQAASHRAAAQVAHEGLAGEDQVLDRLGQVVSATAGHPPLASLHERLRGLAAELTDAADEAREAADFLQEDPERLEEVVARRSVLKEIRRKYAGPAGGLGEVISFHDQARERLQELEDLEGLAQRLTTDHARAGAQLRRASAELGAARRKAALSFASAVENELHRLAMPRARFEVRVGGGDGPDGSDGSDSPYGPDGRDGGQGTQGPQGPRTGATRPCAGWRARMSPSFWPPTRASRPCHWPRWPRAGSWPGPCWRFAWCYWPVGNSAATRWPGRGPWSSTRWTPAWAAKRRWP